MDKQFIPAIDMLKIAAQHAYCADYLLRQNAQVLTDHNMTVDTLLPATTLLYMAFELTLKAYLLHEDRQIRHYKNLLELVELSSYLGFSLQEIQLLNTLSRQHAFRKGVDYFLWPDRQKMQVFCEQVLILYARLQDMMPLELQSDYQ